MWGTRGQSCYIPPVLHFAWQHCSLYNMADMLLQVLGHTKTILVLLGGWMFLGDHISGRQFAGMCLAVAGMVAYGIESSK